jgi:hypothetical protein
MKRTLLVVVAGATTATLIPVQLSTAKASGPAIDRASAPTASLYRNCKALNRVYPHGVGRYGARDHTSGDPVTNFRRSNRLYRLNRGLDRDKDGIACEKK